MKKSEKNRRRDAVRAMIKRCKKGGIFRAYTEKLYRSRKKGSGSYFRWVDVNPIGNAIDIGFYHSPGENKKPPFRGSGSSATYDYKEAKALLRLLQKGIKLMRRGKTA